MPLSWNEIKDRALAFSREWAKETSEDAEAKSFWDGFFSIFGISRRRVASFETPVKKSDGHDGYIDLLWRGVLLVEHKSRGKNLDRAFTQAKDYFPGLKERDLPRYVLVSDFARFRLHDLDENAVHDFPLADLHRNVRLFGFIAGYQTRSYGQEDPVNVKACERMGRLHDALQGIGYQGHDLEVYLVRLLFCLFAEDTGIFERRAFQDWVEQRTAEDGSDLAAGLANLFQVLDTPADKRLKALDEQLAAFPYVNGQIFSERLPLAAFDAPMRALLLDACALDWSRISPAVFGSLFQSVMDKDARRNLGAHYTSETNILKLIGPLFLDEWRAEFARIRHQPKKLYDFHQRLAGLKFFDPACGCGNFLVVAYRELRRLELDVLRALYGKSASQSLDVAAFNILCDVDQFYGIEIEEFPAQIAQAALWLMDHQMNLQVSEEFGHYFARLPLKKSATIVHGNALRLDWRQVCPDADYLLGNPPFVGAKYMNDAQRSDVAAVFGGTKNAGLLDYVACWYRKAVEYMVGEGSPSPQPPPEGRGSPDSSPHRGEAGRGETAPNPNHRIKLPLPEEFRQFARDLRNSLTDAEQLLWQALRQKRMAGHKFRRQHPFPPYVLDFYCHELSLAIELDGGQHLDSAHDAVRDAYLARRGIRVLRYWNHDVLARTESVLEDVWRVVQEIGGVGSDVGPPSPQPPPGGRGSSNSSPLRGEAEFPISSPLRGEAGRGEARCAFVSTNSITQGEQVGALWPDLLQRGVHIHFAHRTFAWSSEARGKAAVHCVIIGFALHATDKKRLFDYETLKAEPHELSAGNINPYLVDGPDVVLGKRVRPIHPAPAMKFGNQPIDGGYLIFTPEEKAEFIAQEPGAERFFRRFIGADEFINGIDRWCLWLVDATPDQLRHLPKVIDRLKAVKRFRLESKREATRELASTPARFAFISHEEVDYLLVPSVSSERRNYIPIGFMPASTIASNLCLIVPNATLHHFGILQSTMHMAWTRAVCGRLKSDYRYSAGIVYNNFPWPEGLPSLQAVPSPQPPPGGRGSVLLPPPGGGREGGTASIVAIETAAQAVLDARANHPGATLADLYDPLTTPPDLTQAHRMLDAAVDAAYAKRKFTGDADRVAFLFELYRKLAGNSNPLGYAGEPANPTYPD